MAWRFVFTISAILLPISIAYAYYRYKFNYFERYGIPHMTAGNPSRRNNSKYLVRRIYKHFKAVTPIAGIYLHAAPTVVILDLELIKRVLIDDFSNFRDRLSDKLFNNDLLHTFGNAEWQATRRKLTPCFWSAKMDLIFPNVIKSANDSITQMLTTTSDNNLHALDLKIFCTHYATNALLSCVFGAELNLNETDESAKALRLHINELLTREYEARFLNNSVMTNICWAQCTTHAQIAKPVVSFQLADAVQAMWEERRTNKVKHNDILQIFIDMLAEECDDATTSERREVRAIQLITQTLATLLTGFANTAKVLTNCLHELAINKEIQQKLRLDNERVLHAYDNVFSYEAMGHMHYLDQVVAETLRKYPIAEVLIRRTLNDYKVPGTTYKIERNTYVLIPVYAIHHDSAIYPASEKFDPNRFDANAVMARHACAYLSFDDGPRNCMGKRLSKMLIKVAVVMLLRAYTIECENVCAEKSPADDEDMFPSSKLNVRIQRIEEMTT